MKCRIKILVGTALAFALFVVLAAPALATTYAPYLVPQAVPTPAPGATAPNGELISDIMAGTSITAQDGWNHVYLHGSPYHVGFQNGYILAQSADEYIIGDHGTPGSANSVKEDAYAQAYIWPLIPHEFQQELQGYADGMAAAGYPQDTLWDILATNCWSDMGPCEHLPYPTVQQAPLLADLSASEYAAVKAAPFEDHSAGDHCSSFAVTGSLTTDGMPVSGHETWYSYWQQFPYDCIVTVNPGAGYDQPSYAFSYKVCGCQIWSGQDYYENSAGLTQSGTALSSDNAYNPYGLPLFIRARESIQHAATCDDACNYLVGNQVQSDSGLVTFAQPNADGGGPGEWLVSDATGTVGSVQSGCLAYDYNHTNEGGYFSVNYPWGPNLLYEGHMYSTHPNGTPNGSGTWPAASQPSRYVRGNQLKAQYAGTHSVDLLTAEAFLGDTYDTTNDLVHHGDSNTICGENDHLWPALSGHYDASGNYYGGTSAVTMSNAGESTGFDGSVTTTALALNGLQMEVRWGHASGDPFFAPETYPQNVNDYIAAHSSWSDFYKFGLTALVRDASQADGTPQPWTMLGANASVDGCPQGWTNKPVTLTFVATAPGNTTQYNVDGAGWVAGNTVSIPAPANGSNDGTHTVQYSAVDGSGTPLPTQTCGFKIDTQLPSVTATPSPSGWTKGPVALSLAPADGASGIPSDYVQTGTYADSGVTRTITANTKANPTSITVSSSLGLTTGATFSVTITGSNSVPSINGTYTGTVTASTRFTIPVNVTTTAGTAGTITYSHGTAAQMGWQSATWYSVDGGAYVEGNAVPAVSGEGHTISYYTKDNAGNVSATQTFNVNNIDTTGPVVTVNAPAENGFYARGCWAIDATSTDAGSGVNAAARTFTLDGAPATAADVTNAVGSHTVVITEYDNVGNSTSVSRDFLAFDSPSMMLSAPNSGSFMQGSSQTVNFSINGAVSLGSFRIWLKNCTTGAWVRCTPAATCIAPVENQTAYSVPWNVCQPAGTYKLWIYYYGADGSVKATEHSTGTITIGQKPTPVVASPNSGSFLRGSSTPVSWTMTSAASDGTFRVWLKNTATNAWVRITPTASPVAAVAGKTTYTVPWFITQPAGTYKLWVYYYAADGSVSATAVSSGAITLS